MLKLQEIFILFLTKHATEQCSTACSERVFYTLLFTAVDVAIWWPFSVIQKVQSVVKESIIILMKFFSLRH